MADNADYEKWIKRNENKMNHRALQRDHISKKCREDIRKFLNTMMSECPDEAKSDPVQRSQTYEFLFKNEIFIRKVFYHAERFFGTKVTLFSKFHLR